MAESATESSSATLTTFNRGRQRSNSVQAPSSRPRYKRSYSNPASAASTAAPTTTASTLLPPPTVKFTTSLPSPVPPRPKRNPARMSTANTPLVVETVFPRVQRTGPQAEITPWELEPPPPEPQSPTSATATTSTTSRGGGGTSGLALFVRRRKSGGKLLRPRTSPLPYNSSAPPPRVIPKSQQYEHKPKPSPAVVQDLKRHSTHIPVRSELDTPSSLSTIKAPPPLQASSSAPLPPTTPTAKHQKQKPSPQPAFSTADRTILEELKRSILARESQFVVKSGGRPGDIGQKHHPYSRQEVPYPRSYERTVVDWDVWETVFCQQLCESLTWHVFESSPGRVLDLGSGTGTWILDCARSWRNCHFVGLDIVPLHPDLIQVGSADLASRITWVQANFLEGLPFPNDEFDYVHIKRIARGVPEDKWDYLLEEIARVMKPGAAFEMIEEDLFFPGQVTSDDTDDELSSDTEDTSLPLSSDSHSQLRISLDDDSSATTVSLAPPSITCSTPSQTPSQNSSPQRSIAEDEEEAPSSIQPTSSKSSLPITGSQSHPYPQVSPGELQNALSGQASKQLRMRAYSQGTDSAPSGRNSAIHFSPAASSKSVNHTTLPGPSHTSHGNVVSSSKSISPELSSSNRISSSPVLGVTPMGFSSVTMAGPFMATSSSTFTPGGSPRASSQASSSAAAPKSFLLRTLPKVPNNPRDHSLLSAIYREMHYSRFINLAPLSLLANSLGIYFKDVRTHPPLQFAFPPKIRLTSSKSSSGSRSAVFTDSSVDGSDADDEEQPEKPLSASSSTHSKHKKNSSLRPPHSAMQNQAMSDTEATDLERNRFISMRGLLKHSSPYISIDGSRMSGYSPSARASISSPTRPGARRRPSTADNPSPSLHPQPSFYRFGQEPPVSVAKHTNHAQTRSRLPNETLHFDIKSLNLHLALRASEVLACSEAMWEWILEYQAKQKKFEKAAEDARRGEYVRRARSGSLSTVMDQQQPQTKSQSAFLASRSSTSEDGTEAQMKAISKLTRADFDELLFNFDFDMKDQMMISSSLEDRFAWKVLPSSQRNVERDKFDKSCEQWEEYVRSQRKQQRQQERQRHPYGGKARRPGTAGSIPPSSFHGNGEAKGGEPKRDGRLRSVSHNSSVPSHTAPKSRRHSVAMLARPWKTKPEKVKLSRAMRVFVAWKAQDDS